MPQSFTPEVADSPLPGLKSSTSIPSAYLQAYKSAGKDYVPRTHHLNDDGSAKYINRLIFQESPYLRQHAHNPVNWHPWGPEAFARAEAEGKLIFLSVGYSTCHWCHVMERESFEDKEIAGYINANYIPIKVDREERPDVDKIYMSAVQMLVGRGGWPMTVFMTFDKLPVFGGTYFPPRDGVRGTRRGFLSILKEYRERYLSHPNELVLEAQDIATRVVQNSKPRPGVGVPNAGAIVRTANTLVSSFDSVHGGFGRAPKFPRSHNLEFLARYYRRSNDRSALKAYVTTLSKMAAGGMYDQVGGGFHRYSVDAKWLVPHFEKMLYDNAQLVVAYLEGFQLTGRGDFSRVATETLDYVAREMTFSGGGFYSATDADSPALNGHDEEGLFFTWTPQEIDNVLKDKTQSLLVKNYYGVTARGNFEGRSILNVTQPLDHIARALDLSLNEAMDLVDDAKTKLYDVRLTRKPPILDDKIIASWNGLMISAFAKGAAVLGRDDYLRSAQKAAEFAMEKLWDGQRLGRAWRMGKVRYDGYLDDYAFMIAGLLDLYEVSQNEKWLGAAVELQAVLDRDFKDSAGGYFFVAESKDNLLARDKPAYDGAIPAGNSVEVLNLLRLSLLTGLSEYDTQARRAISSFGQTLVRGGRSMPKMLAALDFLLDEALQIIVVRPDSAPDKGVLSHVIQERFLPNRVLLYAKDSEIAELSRKVELVAGKKSVGGKPTAYVCRGTTCSLPLNTASGLKKELDKVTLYEL
ncbi:MAG: thioredoxin domain-containing protein [Deltaproteobacteria bacterium]|nr:thioredoxin domain-containing protein [Deltaproteobacteria bacterium]